MKICLSCRTDGYRRFRNGSAATTRIAQCACLPRIARQSQSAARASADRRSRAFSMRLPRAARQSQSAARASADRRSSVFHAFVAAGRAAIPIRGASVSRPSLERFPCVCLSGTMRAGASQPPQPPPTPPPPTQPLFRHGRLRCRRLCRRADHAARSDKLSDATAHTVKRRWQRVGDPNTGLLLRC